MRVLIKSIAWRLFFAVLLVGTGIAAANNYTATQGTGTTFASVAISAVNYASMLICDATVGETNCAAVDSTGALKFSGFDSGAVTATLVNDKWTIDSTVSGSVTFSPNAQSATGSLTIRGPGQTLHCRISWRRSSATVTSAGHTWTAPAP